MPQQRNGDEQEQNVAGAAEKIVAIGLNNFLPTV